MPDAAQARMLQPNFDFVKSIAPARFRGKEHQEAEDRADGRIGSGFVEDMIFDDDFPAGPEIGREFHYQPLVLVVTFAVDDVRKENDVVAPWDRVPSIVAAYEFDARLKSRLSHMRSRDPERAGQFEDRRA